MPEDKRKINCLIPASMYDKIEASDYKNTTEAINAALYHLMNDNKDDMECYIHEIEGYKQSIEGYKKSITALQAENSYMKESVIQLRARYEELERHNETLKRELDKAGLDKEVIQNLYNNYMLQMQTLINQKAIEAPESKKPWYKFW